jgi:hypothetical protein
MPSDGKVDSGLWVSRATFSLSRGFFFTGSMEGSVPLPNAPFLPAPSLRHLENRLQVGADNTQGTSRKDGRAGNREVEQGGKCVPVPDWAVSRTEDWMHPAEHTSCYLTT